MHPLINNIVPDESLLAQALHAQQRLMSFSIPNTASFNLLHNDNTLTIVNLYVVPSMRRQGVGTALFNKIERGAREAGYSLLALSVWMNRPESASAEAFAQRLGLRLLEAGCALELKSYVKPLRPMLGTVPNTPETTQQASGVQA